MEAMNQEDMLQLMDNERCACVQGPCPVHDAVPATKFAPQFELRYEEEAKDHVVKVTEWLKATGMDAEWEIVVAKPNQLLLDYDIPFKKFYPVAFETAMKTMEEAYNLSYSDIGIQWTESKSGNRHGIITFPDRVQFSPMEAAAWQAAAGSDPKREALHIKSVVLGSKNPNLLIERKKVQALLGA
jgi:hypothetical protein